VASMTAELVKLTIINYLISLIRNSAIIVISLQLPVP